MTYIWFCYLILGTGEGSLNLLQGKQLNCDNQFNSVPLKQVFRL